MLLSIFCVDYFPGYSVFTTQTIEAYHEARRQAGADITSDTSRTLEEQLLAVQARLQPAHRMLRRLQHAGAQVLAALWPSETIPHTPEPDCRLSGGCGGPLRGLEGIGGPA